MRSFLSRLSHLLESYKKEGGLFSAFLILVFQLVPGDFSDKWYAKFVSSSAVTILIIALLFIFVDHLRHREARKFFNFRRDSTLYVALPTFYWRAPYRASNKYPSEIYKLTRLTPSSDIPRPGPQLCTFQDTEVITSKAIVGRITENVTVEFIDDQSIIKNGGIRHSAIGKGATLLSYGSDQFNDLSKYILENILVVTGEMAFQFVGEHQLIIHPDIGFPVDTTVATHTLDNTPLNIDYGILAKLFIQSEFGKQNAVFLCAGIDSTATIILVKLLFEQWRAIRKITHDREFVGLYRFNTDEANDYSKNDVFILPIGMKFAFRSPETGLFSVEGKHAH